LLILFQSFNIHINDVLELDALVEHYQFHSEEYGDDFMVFLSKHYGELKAEHHQKHQEEQQEHEELPFQQQCTSLSPLVFIPNEVLVHLSRSEVPTTKTDDFHYLASYTSRWGDGPFQPPRLA